MRAIAMAALVAAAAGCKTLPSRPPLGPREQLDEKAAVPARALVDGEIALFTADATAVYWVAADALWRRTWAGPAVRLAALPAVALALAVRGDKIYVVNEKTVVAVPVAGGAARTVATGLPPWNVVALDADGAWFGTDGGIVRAALDGHAPEQIASGLGPVEAIATGRDAVFAAVDSGAPPDGDLVATRLVRLAKRGGAPVTLAERQYGVRGLAVAGDRLMWASQRGPAVASVPIAGGRRRVDLGGTAAALAADDGGAVIMTPGGALAETTGARGAVARGLPTHRLAGTGAIALAGAGVVVPMLDLATGAGSLWWVPRPLAARDAAAILAWPYHTITAAAVDGGDVVFLDATRVDRGDRPSRVMRVPRRGGRGRAIAQAPTLGQLAAGGGRIAYAAGAALWLIDRKPGGDRPPRLVSVASDPPLGLTVTDRALYWADGQRVLTVPLAGGAPTEHVDPQLHLGASELGPVDLIVDRDAVYFSSLGAGAVGMFAAPRGGPVRTLVEEPALADGLARAGSALYAIVDGSGVVRVPMAGGARRTLVAPDPAATILRLVGAGRALVALRVEGEAALLEELDPLTGARRPLWTLPAPTEASANVMTADDAAVYTYLADSAWLIAVPR